MIATSADPETEKVKACITALAVVRLTHNVHVNWMKGSEDPAAVEPGGQSSLWVCQHRLQSSWVAFGG